MNNRFVVFSFKPLSLFFFLSFCSSVDIIDPSLRSSSNTTFPTKEMDGRRLQHFPTFDNGPSPLAPGYPPPGPGMAPMPGPPLGNPPMGNPMQPMNSFPSPSPFAGGVNAALAPTIINNQNAPPPAVPFHGAQNSPPGSPFSPVVRHDSFGAGPASPIAPGIQASIVGGNRSPPGSPAPIHRKSTLGDEKVRLFQAIQKGDTKVASDIIYSFPNCHYWRNEADSTPLHFVVMNGWDVNIVRFLLDNGANVNAQNKDMWTPLHFATRHSGDEQVIRMLVSKGSKVNAITNKSLSPLHLATWYGSKLSWVEKVVRLLIENGANTNLKTTSGKTPCALASERKLKTIVSIYENAKSNAQSPPLSPQSPSTEKDIFSACTKGQPDEVARILSTNQNAHAFRDQYQSTPLHIAAWYGHQNIVALLLEKGADKHAQNKEGDTPKIYAQKNGHHAIVDLLTERRKTPLSQSNPDLKQEKRLSNHRFKGNQPLAQIISSPSALQKPKSSKPRKMITSSQFSWPMQVLNATKTLNGVYELTGKLLGNRPVFKMKGGDFYLYSRENQWFISKQEGGEAATATLVSMDREDKEMPSCIKKWEGRGVLAPKAEVRDCVSFRNIFSNLNSSSSRVRSLQRDCDNLERALSMSQNLETATNLFPEGLAFLGGVMTVFKSLEKMAAPLTKSFCCLEAVFGVVERIGAMAMTAVMNTQKCLLLVQRIKSITPTLQSLQEKLQKKLNDMMEVCPVPSSEWIDETKADLVNLEQPMQKVSEAISNANTVICEWEGISDNGKGPKKEGKGKKRFKKVLRAVRKTLTADSMEHNFTQAAQWLDSALQDLNVAISSRMFSKIDIMFERMNEFQWQEDIKRADKIDKQNVEGDIKKLMDENEEFREEMRELLGEIQNEIKYEFRGLRENLAQEFARINVTIDAIQDGQKEQTDLIKRVLEGQQQQQEFEIIPWEDILHVKQENRGAHGMIYSGKWNNKRIAVKLMDGNNRGYRVVKEIEREAKTHWSLRHHNIVLFHGLVEGPGKLGLVMEWAAPDLLFFLTDRPESQKIPWSQRCTMALQIAQGMKFVHSSNVLHHDLRAANVLLGSPKGSRLCRLCDFGLSRWKSEASKMSVADSKSGNDHWLAPEYRGGNYTPQCDVFSYGVVLYEIATHGELPFRDKDRTVSQLYRNGQRNEILRQKKDIHEKFNALIQLCWHQDPSRRPAFSQIVSQITSWNLADKEITV